MTASQSFYFLLLFVAATAQRTPTRRVVSSCAGLKSALEEQTVETIEVQDSFDCDTSMWNSSLLIDRDVTVQGRMRQDRVPFIDWGTSSKDIIADRGIHIEFQDLIFLQQDMGIGNIDILFFQTAADATASFRFIVVGVISCPWTLNVSRFESLERPDHVPGQQVIEQIDRQTVEAVDVVLDFPTRSSFWHLRHTVFSCNVFKHDPAVNRYYQMARDQSNQLDLGSDDDGNSNDVWHVVGYIVAALAGACGFLFVIWVVIRWNQRKNDPFKLATFDEERERNIHTESASDMYNKFNPTPDNWAMLDSDVVLEQPLGHGGLGKVYKGCWQGTTVAVKVIKHNDSVRTNVGGPLEAFFAKHISHPNVIQTYQISKKVVEATSSRTRFFGSPDEQKNKNRDSRSGSDSSDMFGSFGEEENVRDSSAFETWLILEYCDRGSLSDAVREGVFRFPGADKRFRMSYVARTALEIASAMNYLHSVRIIHGDLKTGNVLLKGDGSDRRGFICKVGDFGLSRFLAEDSHIETLTRGTVTHMPPELLEGGVLTSAADVFSFGILLWELLSGEKPHQGKTQGEVIIAVVQNQYRPPFPPNVPRDFVELVESCWDQLYDERPIFPDIIDRLTVLVAKYEKEEGVESDAGIPVEIEAHNTRSSFFSHQETEESQYLSGRGRGIRIVPKFSSLKEKETVQSTAFLDSNRSLHLSLDRADPTEATIISIPTSKSVGSRVHEKSPDPPNGQ